MDNDVKSGEERVAVISEDGLSCSDDGLRSVRILRALSLPDCSSRALNEGERLVVWPALEQLELGADALAARAGTIGGSDANTILSGDPERVLNLWREKRGEKASDDLSDRLAVALGSWTEPFNRLWYEKLSGRKVELVGATLSCSTYAWRRCTLDGFVVDQNCVWEAKHTSAFAKADEVLERYMPQLQHNMAVAKADRAVLSVIFGNSKYEIFEIASDWLYQLDLLQAEEDFWECVQTGQAPVAVAPPAPPKPVGTREVSLEGNNHWASAAADWLEHRDAARRHASACQTIKSLVEDDVSRAFGHGIEARRSKSHAISIRELAR